ncbi:LysM peptidoglycan-binding domain-containing protein [Citreimonas salinaria]|uniref:Nucleoid-associated protein YgaU, contains BON and LysM domains n=1 Tax=Citreimonas salinaria TaxID=321339 RepID=A0A1H3H3Q2_9RHOB|nr:LysM peptidoglycan-binding domain-containing protein [Citreimonas salinaria]SDY09538.1 Nucleoid-associated protein YgaU, contains BON and LysM domains [Citreimonas salinaria]
MSRAALFGGLAAGAAAVVVAVAVGDGWLRPDVAPLQEDGAGPMPPTDVDASPAPAKPAAGGPKTTTPVTATPDETPPAPDPTPVPDPLEAAGGSPTDDGAATGSPAPVPPASEAPAVADADPIVPMPDATTPDAPGVALREGGDISAPAAAPEAPGGVTAEPAMPATGVAMPAFDLVRAESDGSALVAGSAEPGAAVELLLDGEVAARTDVAGDGRFVLFLDMPDDGRAHVLALRQSAGDSVIVSLDEVIVAPPTALAAAAPHPEERDRQAGAPRGVEPQGQPAADDPDGRTEHSALATAVPPAADAPAMPGAMPSAAALRSLGERVGAGPAVSEADGGRDVAWPDAPEAADAATAMLRSGLSSAGVATPPDAPGPQARSITEAGKEAAPAADLDTAEPASDTRDRAATGAEPPARGAPSRFVADAGATASGTVGAAGDGADTVATDGEGRAAPDSTGADLGDVVAGSDAMAPSGAGGDAPTLSTLAKVADLAAEDDTGGAVTTTGEDAPAAESAAPRTLSAPAEITLPQTPSAGAPVDIAAAPAPEPAGPARPMVLRSTPQGVEVMPDAPLAPGQVALDQVTYDDAGAVQFAGRGDGGGFVRLYLDNAPVGTARIAADGRWRTTLPQVDTGTYTLRVDRIDESGAVTARAESPFRRVDPAVLASARADGAAVSVTVQPGNTLWGISRVRYGEGIDYVRIFDANRDQIRDPDLIYPGQIFDLPE